MKTTPIAMALLATLLMTSLPVTAQPEPAPCPPPDPDDKVQQAWCTTMTTVDEIQEDIEDVLGLPLIDTLYWLANCIKDGDYPACPDPPEGGPL